MEVSEASSATTPRSIDQALREWNSSPTSRPSLPFHSPFMALLEIQVLQWDEQGASLSVSVDERFTNGLGIAHGGLLLTALDAVLGMAALATAAGKTRGVLTANLSTHFVRPGLGKLLAVGRCIQSLGPVLNCIGHIEAADGGLIARAEGQFTVRRQKPTP